MLLLGIGTVLLFSFCPSAGAQRVVGLEDPVSTKTVTVPEEHSATKALLWSILPGGGQVYNGQAWKIPIIYGALAGVGYYAYYNYDRMVMFKDEYLYRVNNDGATNLSDYASYPTSSIYSLYNSYNRNFQLMVIIAAGIYALNLVDAYVFGHLYDFRIDDDLTLAVSPGLQPTLAGWQPTVGLTLSF